MRKAMMTEAYEQRTDRRAIRYALGAMQAVGAEYTKNSIEEGDRIKEKLRTSLLGEIDVDFRYQGSVPLDIHIKGVSDIDLLVLRDDFFSYDASGERALAGKYKNPIPDSILLRLQTLRSRCIEILTNA
jgi:hypothetical protein